MIPFLSNNMLIFGGCLWFVVMISVRALGGTEDQALVIASPACVMALVGFIFDDN